MSYRFGVVVVASSVTDHTVADEAVPWKEEGVADRGQQHLFGFRKEPLDGNVAENRTHGFLQRLYHLWSKNINTDSL